MKKILVKGWASCVALSRQLRASFGDVQGGKGLVKGFWIADAQVIKLDSLSRSIGCLPVDLVCRPGCDLGPALDSERQADQGPLTIVVTRLEALVPFIQTLASTTRELGTVLVVNASQMSCAHEQRSALSDPHVVRSHEQSLARTLRELKGLGVKLGLNLVIYDQQELFGHKNSALFERLFLNR